MPIINLGQVAALVSGAVSPSNTDILWLDTSGGGRVLRYYRSAEEGWAPLAGAAEAEEEEIVLSPGPDMTLSLAGKTRLDGVVLIGRASTLNRKIPSILWEQVSGDDGMIISRETSLNPVISNLLTGLYVINISARYDADTVSFASIRITVTN